MSTLPETELKKIVNLLTKAKASLESIRYKLKRALKILSNKDENIREQYREEAISILVEVLDELE